MAQTDLFKITVELGLVVGFIDGHLDDREINIIVEFFRERPQLLPRSIRSRADAEVLRTIDSLRPSLSRRVKTGKKQELFSDLEQLCEQLAKMGNIPEINGAYELCVQISAADGQIDESESKLLHRCSELLGIDSDFERETKERILRLSMYAARDAIAALEIPVKLNRKEREQWLKKAMTRWRQRATHNDPEIRKEVDEKIKLIMQQLGLLKKYDQRLAAVHALRAQGHLQVALEAAIRFAEDYAWDVAARAVADEYRRIHAHAMRALEPARRAVQGALPPSDGLEACEQARFAGFDEQLIKPIESDLHRLRDEHAKSTELYQSALKDRDNHRAAIILKEHVRRFSWDSEATTGLAALEQQAEELDRMLTRGRDAGHGKVRPNIGRVACTRAIELGAEPEVIEDLSQAIDAAEENHRVTSELYRQAKAAHNVEAAYRQLVDLVRRFTWDQQRADELAELKKTHDAVRDLLAVAEGSTDRQELRRAYRAWRAVCKLAPYAGYQKVMEEAKRLWQARRWRLIIQTEVFVAIVLVASTVYVTRTISENNRRINAAIRSLEAGRFDEVNELLSGAGRLNKSDVNPDMIRRVTETASLAEFRRRRGNIAESIETWQLAIDESAGTSLRQSLEKLIPAEANSAWATLRSRANQFRDMRPVDLLRDRWATIDSLDRTGRQAYIAGRFGEATQAWTSATEIFGEMPPQRVAIAQLERQTLQLLRRGESYSLWVKDRILGRELTHIHELDRRARRLLVARKFRELPSVHELMREEFERLDVKIAERANDARDLQMTTKRLRVPHVRGVDKLEDWGRLLEADRQYEAGNKFLQDDQPWAAIASFEKAQVSYRALRELWVNRFLTRLKTEIKDGRDGHGADTFSRLEAIDLDADRVNEKRIELWQVRDRDQIVNSIGAKMVRIPSGTFRMGPRYSTFSTTREYGGRSKYYEVEHPQHVVVLTQGFRMSATEITVGQFRHFIKATGYKTSAASSPGGGQGYWIGAKQSSAQRPRGKIVLSPEYNWERTGFSKSDRYPVVNVSWNDAVAFCNWLSQQENQTYRLPTEAEWEYACRAGTLTSGRFPWPDSDDARKYVNGFDFTRRAAGWAPPGEGRKIFAFEDGYEWTAPAGEFQPNPLGLHDMLGNVAEWCSDRFGPYPQSRVIDPVGAAAGDQRVVRGGSFATDVGMCRPAARRKYDPAEFTYHIGFRIVMEHPK